MSKKEVVNEIHRYARKNFERRKYTMYGIADTLQADLIEMQPYAKENRGHRYILIVIDIFSKMAYALPLKDKTGPVVTKAMEHIIRQVNQHNPQHTIKNLHTDEGKEFYNHHMKNLLETYKINHYSTYSLMKASICERLIRTIKRKIYIQMNLEGTLKWIDFLPDIIDRYNNTR